MPYELDCSDSGMDCEFTIRSADRNELVDVVQQHAREVHDLELSRSDVTNLMRSV